jgi:hypothetical protein
LKLEGTTGDGQPTVLRCTPGLFVLYTLVVRLSLPLPSSSSTLRAVFWQGKSAVTFAERLTGVRRALWHQWCVHTQAHALEFSTLSRSVQETSLDALAPAA